MLWIIKYRLLFSYLLVVGSVLGVFTSHIPHPYLSHR
jgi:hypothetical protein